MDSTGADLSLDVDELRDQICSFLDESVSTEVACPAYGAILTPALHQRAVAWQRHCQRRGFAGLHWPEDHGGRGLTRRHTAVWYEECARKGIAPYLNLQGIVLAGEAILRSGTTEQQAALLRPTLGGDVIWCQLFSEPGAGSDLASLATTAVVDGDRFVVNGQKVWSSNAQIADFGILLARTDTDKPRHRGISFFLIDMSLPGIEVRPLRQMTGDAEFCEVFLTEVELASSSLLGGLNEGWAVAMEVLTDERGAFGSAGAISLQQRLNGLAALGPTNPVARDGLARLLTEGHALQALLGRIGNEPSAAPAAKLLRTEIETSAINVEAGLRGPDTMLIDERTEAFLYAPGMRIAGGSSEIQRNIIGERVLGLPREPGPERGATR